MMRLGELPKEQKRRSILTLREARVAGSRQLAAEVSFPRQSQSTMHEGQKST